MVDRYPIPFLVSEARTRWPKYDGAIGALLAAVVKVKQFSGGKYDFTLEKIQAEIPAAIAGMSADDLYNTTEAAYAYLGSLLEEARAERQTPAENISEVISETEETVGASQEPTLDSDRDDDNRTDDISHSPIKPEPVEPSASAEPGSHRPSRRRAGDGVRDNGQRQKRTRKLADAPLAGTRAE